MKTLPRIHEAARLRDVYLVYRIVKENPQCVNKWDYIFRTPLHAVFECLNRSVQDDNALSIVQFLLENGADVNASAIRDRTTALDLAIKTHQTRVIKLLLEYGADPNISESCLYWAVYHYTDKNLVKSLLNRGANPESLFSTQYYIYDADLDVYSMLLDIGGKVRYIYDMIESAIRNGHEEVIEYLLRHSDHFNPNGRFSLTELILYIDLNPNKGYFVWMEEILEEMGYSIEKQNFRKNTPLHVFIANGDYYSAKSLLNTSKFVNATNDNGDTPFHLLFRQNKNETRSKFYEMIRLFLKHGAEINIRNCFNQTPFSLAVVFDYREAIIIMLANITGLQESTLNTMEHRITEDCEDIHFNVPIEINSFELYIAIYLDYVEVVDRLVDMGCNKRNPFYINYAIKNRRYKITKILYEAGFQGLKEEYPFATRDYEDDDLFKKENLKLLSLVWTFNEDSILKLPLTHILMWTQIMRNSREMEIFVFFFALELDLKKPSYTYTQLKNLQFSEFDPFRMIDQLKKNKLCKNNSMYDILMMNFDSLVNFLNDPGNFDDCLNLCKIIQDKPENEIECCEIVLLEKISLAIERRRLWNHAAVNLNFFLRNSLNSLNYYNLPEEIVRKIFSYLSVKDLRNIKLEEVRNSPCPTSRTQRYINFLKIPFLEQIMVRGWLLINRFISGFFCR